MYVLIYYIFQFIGKALKIDGQEFVKNGLNPVAGMTQAHYLKGYFLLHFLMESIGCKQKFYSLIKVIERCCKKWSPILKNICRNMLAFIMVS